MPTLIRAIVLLVVLSYCSSCSIGGSHSNPPSRAGGFAIFPYVQAVDLPGVIRAGVAFEIKLTYSLPVAMDRQWLGGPERQYAPADLLINPKPEGGGTIVIYSVLDPSFPDGEWTQETRQVTFNVEGLPAGDYWLVYYGGLSREESGQLIPVHLPVFQPEDFESNGTPRHVVNFTVLP